MTIIRPSSLPSYVDCPRRTAARLFREDVEAAGYVLRQTPQGIGAAIGTAVHAGAHQALRPRVEGKELAPADEAEGAAFDNLRSALADGVAWDEVSPTQNASEKQVLRMVRRWREDVAPRFVPEHVEVRLEADMAGVTVSGQVDVAAGDVIRDLKTGRTQRANGAQYGMYSLLWRAHGHDIGRLVEDYVPRAPVSKLQPAAVTTEIDVADAEAAAEAIAKRMVADLDEFRATSNPWAFLANPASMLCGDKWCPAWGTKWCKVHKGVVG